MNIIFFILKSKSMYNYIYLFFKIYTYIYNINFRTHLFSQIINIVYINIIIQDINLYTCIVCSIL